MRTKTEMEQLKSVHGEAFAVADGAEEVPIQQQP